MSFLCATGRYFVVVPATDSNDEIVSGEPIVAARMTDKRRRMVEVLWVAAAVAYGLGRAIVVWKTLGDYGVNPWVYGVLDVVSAVPYAIGTARVVTGVIDRDWARVRLWGTIAAVAFLVPDLYIVIVGKSMPWVVYVVLGVWFVGAVYFAVRSVTKKVRANRLPQ